MKITEALIRRTDNVEELKSIIDDIIVYAINLQDCYSDYDLLVGSKRFIRLETKFSMIVEKFISMDLPVYGNIKSWVGFELQECLM